MDRPVRGALGCCYWWQLGDPRGFLACDRRGVVSEGVHRARARAYRPGQFLRRDRVFPVGPDCAAARFPRGDLGAGPAAVRGLALRAAVWRLFSTFRPREVDRPRPRVGGALRQ
eukprot:6712358-Pyramimonas_sp.AAC.1